MFVGETNPESILQHEEVIKKKEKNNLLTIVTAGYSRLISQQKSFTIVY